MVIFNNTYSDDEVLNVYNPINHAAPCQLPYKIINIMFLLPRFRSNFKAMLLYQSLRKTILYEIQ